MNRFALQVLLQALGCVTVAVPTPVALDAAQARGGAAAEADCLMARLELPVAVLQVSASCLV